MLSTAPPRSNYPLIRGTHRAGARFSRKCPPARTVIYSGHGQRPAPAAAEHGRQAGSPRTSTAIQPKPRAATLCRPAIAVSVWVLVSPPTLPSRLAPKSFHVPRRPAVGRPRREGRTRWSDSSRRPMPRRRPTSSSTPGTSRAAPPRAPPPAAGAPPP